jgi:RNA polymerase sigma-32 factor
MLVNTSSFQAFKSTVCQIPILTKEQEQDLTSNLTEESARTLIMSHLRFVAYVVQSYKGYDMPEEELVQEGTIGLMKAVKKFDPSHGVRLASYAVFYIKNAIQEYIMRNLRAVRLVTTKPQRRLFFGLRQFVKDNPEYTMDDLIQRFDTDEQTIRDMQSRLYNDDRSMDTPLEDGQTLYDIIEGEYDDVDNMIDHNRLMSRVSQSLDSLNDRQRDIIQKRYLSDEKVTLAHLADQYKISKERARQIESQALR